jgi:hypothetical protein
VGSRTGVDAVEKRTIFQYVCSVLLPYFKPWTVSEFHFMDINTSHSIFRFPTILIFVIREREIGISEIIIYSLFSTTFLLTYFQIGMSDYNTEQCTIFL